MEPISSGQRTATKSAWPAWEERSTESGQHPQRLGFLRARSNLLLTARATYPVKLLQQTGQDPRKKKQSSPPPSKSPGSLAGLDLDSTPTAVPPSLSLDTATRPCKHTQTAHHQPRSSSHLAFLLLHVATRLGPDLPDGSGTPRPISPPARPACSSTLVHARLQHGPDDWLGR